MDNILNIDSEIKAGMSISDAASIMVKTANQVKGFVMTTFNNICLISDETSTVELIVQQYNDSMNEADTAYRTNDKYNLLKQKEQTEIIAMQKQVDSLTADLSKLDFTNLNDVLNWIVKFEHYSDRIGVKVDKAKISSIFDQKADILKGFKNSDKEKVALSIIFQTLEALNFCSIHSTIPGFIHDWNEKFEQKLISAN